MMNMKNRHRGTKTRRGNAMIFSSPRRKDTKVRICDAETRGSGEKGTPVFSAVSSLCLCASVVSFYFLACCPSLFAQDAPRVESNAKHYPERRADQPSATASAIRATFRVAPGQTIQSAVDRCRPGDRIEVLPGTYKEAVVVDLDNIELAGIVADGERPLLDGENKLNDAVMVSGHNFTISGFEMRNYTGNGVVVNKAKNVTFRDLVAHNTGKYAVYPVECDGVLVEHCVASGDWDAAIYAGQCKDVVVQNCESYNNTIGIEAENCVNVLFANNSTHENSLGILVVLLPNLPSKVATNARVINNRVLNNNYPNLSPPGNIVNLVRPGVGIAINAADNSEITRNEISGHNNYGIAMYGLADVLPDATKLDVEPNPDGNFIHDNTLAKNGEDPAKIDERFKKFSAPGGDLFWSGRGTGNVWTEATQRTFPAKLTPNADVPPVAGAK